MELLPSLADEVQSNRSKCKATTWQLDTSNAKVKELKLKLSLLVDEARKLGKMQ